ncbi:1294_t:CDS:1 [Acaulospora colombiana]|uniref:1294_t:CDS:1 n=1 Tax=Acaulospora colombiana TaxID=27376 RepID=A0ACA9LQK3_9GLOM|nr:1294_t:CDS:1 [Acaulospora colombiana]
MSEEKDTTFTIRSGGQTGVDRAALDAALRYRDHVRVTGWCPRGRLAEDGEIPLEYPLVETTTDSYQERTELNIRDSDATLVLLLPLTPPDQGTEYTLEKAKLLGKPFLRIFLDDTTTKVNDVLEWTNRNKVKDLNVAGPRESSSPKIQNQAYKFMKAFLREKVESLRQTH